MKFSQRILTSVAAAVLCLHTPAFAQTGAQMAPGAMPAHKLIFVDPAHFDPALTLPAPFAPDSAEGRAELDAVRATVAAATPAEIAQAARDDGNESATYLADVLPGFDLAKLPATRKLFDDVRNDENIEAGLYKKHFARFRPYELDPTIPTCVPSKPTAPGKTPSSYPSGHGVLGYSTAVVLAHLMPEKAEVIFQRARRYGHNRVICGVHFPSDIVASQTIGTLVAYDLLGNTEFRKEYDAAHAELVAARLTQ